MAYNHKKTNALQRKITSTSDLTLEDIVEFVAGELPHNPCREKIEKIVKETVRPCAIGSVPTVVAGGVKVVPVSGVGIGIGRSGCGCVGREPACDPDGVCRTDVSRGRAAHDDAPGMPVGAVDNGDTLMKAVDRDKNRPCFGKTSAWYDIVLQNGEVWTPYTNRRFLPAQYLAMMLNYKGNINAAIARRYSLRDCFKLMDTEIEKLAFIETKCRTAFAERRLFLTVETIRAIFDQYLKALRDNVNDREKCTFAKRSGEYWRKIQGEGRVVLWTEQNEEKNGANGFHSEETTISPTDWLSNLNNSIETMLRRLPKVSTYEQALDFLRKMPQVSMGTFKDSEGNVRYWLPKIWKESFLKQGAYYTLKSLIVNKHVRFATEEGDWRHKEINACESARDGLIALRKLAEPEVPSYVVHAILKKSIEVAKFDIAKFLRQVCKR